jgi:hypothetical protein
MVTTFLAKISGAADPRAPGDTIHTMKNSMLAAAALFLPLASPADETFRCGKWIASSAMTVAELTEKCGEPTARTSRTEDVKVRNRNVGLMMKVGETTIETWTYDRGANPDMVVTIVDGAIKSIDRQK